MKLRCSKAVWSFKKKAEKIWKLEEYDPLKDKGKPTVFFGLYTLDDYEAVNCHEGKRYVFWCGADILASLRDQKVRLIIQGCEVEHFCENQLEADELKTIGIEANVSPSFLEDIEDFPICFKPSKNPQVFLSSHPDRDKDYGIDIVLKIASIVPSVGFHIYGIERESFGNIHYHGIVSNKEFNKDIRNYHCGLRLNEHDGCSEIMIKSLLMGQHPISRISYPFVTNYRTEKELVDLLVDLQNITEPNTEARKFWVNNLNKYPWIK